LKSVSIYNNANIIFNIVGADYADPFDATAIAETELLSAANAIEAAARKLSQLKPKQRPKV